MTVQNDQELKEVLSGLPIDEQRVIAAQFVESVGDLNSDPVIIRALEVAANKESSDTELNELYSSVKTLAIKTYTACGEDADWKSQAQHFVATATKACLTPFTQLTNKTNLAWNCAMQARMAKNCDMIEADSDIIDNEAQKQYRIINNYLH